jgi:hypothetical protein
MTTITLNDSELATVLAALRHWQFDMENRDGFEPENDLIATNMDRLTPLDSDAIDLLCERINVAPEAIAEPPNPYETLARAVGWMQRGDGPIIFHGPTWSDDWKSAVSWSGTDREPKGPNDKPAIYDTWEECYRIEFQPA